MNDQWKTDKRIINVSNRLPIKLSSSTGQLAFQKSEGGLATALSSAFKNCKNMWIGWPGATVEEADREAISAKLAEENLYPLYLDQEEINNFYEGFSNETVWPLFHYFPTYSKYKTHYWDSYLAVNQKFANMIITHARPDDIIWIQDYQLMLVPAMVRAAMPNATIGYFQHIPFPDFEIFRALPWKKEILEGLLGANMIGFQTEGDVKHFMSTAAKVLNIQPVDNQFYIEERNVIVNAFPISIDCNKFKQLAVDESTVRNAKKIKDEINTRIAISIDRLDYSKGIIQRLEAFDLFLKRHPEWHQKISLVHLVVPSRDNCCNYKELKEEMDRLISSINGKYATFDWHPIRHFYRSFPPAMLSALYKVADVALVTPLRDGMNLVSKEYVTGNISANGVLLLSEAAGAARELTDALQLNPNDTSQFADKIFEALNMPEEERTTRMRSMQAIVEKSDIFTWVNKFITNLLNAVRNTKFNVCKPVDNTVSKQIVHKYDVAKKRLLLLDYDGTLVSFKSRPDDAYPDKELLAMLAELASDKRNSVVIISGRDKETLENWLGGLTLDMVGEHGAWLKESGVWRKAKGLETSWKGEIKEMLAKHSNMLPGSFLEDKSFSTAWHYRAADSALAERMASHIVEELRRATDGKELTIMHGNKVIEIKSSLVNKGYASLQCIARNNYDFILAIGDDLTDEDMFKVLPAHNSVSIKIGSTISAATFSQNSVSEVRALLKKFTRTAGNRINSDLLIVINQS